MIGIEGKEGKTMVDGLRNARRSALSDGNRRKKGARQRIVENQRSLWPPQEWGGKKV